LGKPRVQITSEKKDFRGKRRAKDIKEASFLRISINDPEGGGCGETQKREGRVVKYRFLDKYGNQNQGHGNRREKGQRNKQGQEREFERTESSGGGLVGRVEEGVPLKEIGLMDAKKGGRGRGMVSFCKALSAGQRDKLTSQLFVSRRNREGEFLDMTHWGSSVGRGTY